MERTKQDKQPVKADQGKVIPCIENDFALGLLDVAMSGAEALATLCF